MLKDKFRPCLYDSVKYQHFKSMGSESSPLLEARRLGSNTPTNGDAFGVQPLRQRIAFNIYEGLHAAGEHVSKFKVLCYIGAFSFIIDVSFMMMIAPMARLTELGLCRKHFLLADPSIIDRNGNIPELLCKIKPVQASLAKLNGILAMLAMLPSELVVSAATYLYTDDEFSSFLLRAIRYTCRQVWKKDHIRPERYRAHNRISLVLLGLSIL